MFKDALPALIFLNFAQLEVASVLNPVQLAFELGATLTGFALLWLLSGWLNIAPVQCLIL